MTKKPEHPDSPRPLWKPLTLFSLVLWLILAPIAWMFSGNLGLEGLTLSAFLCLIPGWLVFWIVSRYGDTKNYGILILGGTSVRMAIVLFGILIVDKIGRYPEITDFVIWILLFFLATLVFETLLLLKLVKSASDNKDNDN